MKKEVKSLSRAVLKRNRVNLIVGLIVLISVVVLISVIGWLVQKPSPEVLQGEVEANEVRVSGKLAGRIQAFLVEEGTYVQAGDTLVQLSSPELLAKLAQAEAAMSAAEAQNQKAVKGVRKELITGAFEMWQKAKAGLEVAEKSYNRASNLFENGVITAQHFDEAEAMYKAAVATEKAAKSQYDMAFNGAEPEDKQAARSLVDRALGAVTEVKSYIPETRLTAPLSGEISEIYPHVGELVGQGAPIMSITDIDHCWITFNVREDQLSKLQMGTVVSVSIPALDTTNVLFKVSYIKAMGGYATWKATKMSGDYDVKTFEVRAKPVTELKGLRPGMSVLLEKTETKK
jgi:HlyD family secretion protein